MTDASADRPELAALRSSLDRLVTSAATATEHEGEWSPTLVLGHLSQVDTEVWLPRVEQMVDARHRGLSSPSFSWWESAPGSTEVRFGGHSLEAAGETLVDARTTLVAALSELAEDDWSAIAHHDVFGVIDVVGWCARCSPTTTSTRRASPADATGRLAPRPRACLVSHESQSRIEARTTPPR